MMCGAWVNANPAGWIGMTPGAGEAGMYDLVLLIVGVALGVAAACLRVLKRLPISLPMVYVAVGLLLATVWRRPFHFDPVEHGHFAERLTELAVIISLMSAGLKLDRPAGWRNWKSTWRLLVVTMPLCIVALALSCGWGTGLPLAAAVLLGAAIAPTDPVLASSVQVGPPGEGDENEPRFALTSEAGLNDGLAFPFVNLAIVLAATGLAPDGLLHWFGIDLVWRIAVAVVIGSITGHCFALIMFRCCSPGSGSGGFVAVALTLLAYGSTQLANGYGFIGVFVAALWFRRYEREHEYHKDVHKASEKLEHGLMVLILVLFGAAIADGLLSTLSWQVVLVGLGFLLVVRPAAGMLGLLRMNTRRSHRLVIAVYGIRGIGTFYYLAHGLNQIGFGGELAQELWGMAGFIVLASIVMHGMTASTIMRRLDA